jgi:FeS assembly SUF system regulator
MIRISRLTDYGIVLMRYMATHADRVHNAAEVAATVHLPVPTVSKLLRTLARGGLLDSHRGVKGGYTLAAAAEQISVARIVRALEGPIALTTCTTDSPSDCEHESLCPVRDHWQKINTAVVQALENVRLSDMVTPAARPARGGLSFGSGETAPLAARAQLAARRPA